VEQVTGRTVSHYSIKEAAALTGLPASTLRYYESIGVIAPVGRGETSKHRVYTEEELDQIMSIACLAATGLSVKDLQQYVANGKLGAAAADEQIELLTAQRERLAVEAKLLAVRRQYVQIKIAFWHAVNAGDAAQVELLGAESRALADQLTRGKQK
jgi:DNA-binding transcriptional MerR regulator